MISKRIIKDLLLLTGTITSFNKKSKILYYHDVYSDKSYTDMGTPISVFRRHMDIIRRKGFEIVPHIDKPEKQVCIMFDDGFKGIYDCREFFYESKIQPTVFLAVSLLNQPGYLSAEDVKDLEKHGFFFQSHGWEHASLVSLSDNDLHKELVDAKVALEGILEREVSDLCLPIGHFSRMLIDRIKKEGYTDIYSSIPGNYDDLVYGMRRRNLVQFCSPFEVNLILHGGLSLLSKWYLRMHQVV